MKTIRQLTEAKILSEMKKYKQQNLSETKSGLTSTGGTTEKWNMFYEIFCIIMKKFDPVLLEKLLGVSDLFDYLKQLWNKTKISEEKKDMEEKENE